MAKVYPAKEFFRSTTSESAPPPSCPYCAGDISELSQAGKDNHLQFCFLVHLEPISQKISANHHGGPVSETVQARKMARGAL